MSDTPKWAPGPYRTYRNEIGEGETGIAAGSTCEGFRKVGVAFGDSIEQANAQAKLFAAAPELYDALQGALRLLETDGGYHDIWHRALEKARGEK